MKNTDMISWSEVRALVEHSLTACEEWQKTCEAWMRLYDKVVGMTFWQRVAFILLEGPRSNKEAP